MSLHLDPGVIGSSMNRNDLHLTSTGKGHDTTKGYYFPPSLYRRVLPDVLPPNKQVPDFITNKNNVMSPYQTTNKYFHNEKRSSGSVLRNPEYKLAISAKNVNYCRQLYEKLQESDSNRLPLTMGYQTSETSAKFVEKNPYAFNVKYPAPLKEYKLENHHNQGPSQQVIGSTHNSAMTGREYFVPDQGALKLNDIYLSTTNKNHRRFTKSEQNGIAKKNFATYWDSEGYPQVWGHGSKRKPLAYGIKNLYKQSPACNSFCSTKKLACNTSYHPRVVPRVPFMGMRTTTADVHSSRNHLMHKFNLYCPIDQQYLNTKAGVKEIMQVPHMYKTEYNMIGSGRPVTCS